MDLFEMDKQSPWKQGEWEEEIFKLTSFETEHLIQTLDPHGHNLINYSDIVKIFTSKTYTISHKTSENVLNLTILEKFVTKQLENEDWDSRIQQKLETKFDSLDEEERLSEIDEEQE